jgi:mono/diheme cytochrome c family protein
MKPVPFALAVAVLLAVGGPSRGLAQEPAVPGFHRLFNDDKADRAHGGQLLLGELNCTSCHQPGDAAPGRKQAPVLDAVGTRVRVSHLKQFLSDPQKVKPGTTMPNVFAGDPDKDAKVEALVHFLASTGTPRHERSDLKALAVGRDLFHKAGCVACHGPRNAAGLADQTPAGCVPLGDLKAKYTNASLAAFLADPLPVRPSGRMPHLLSAKEAREVAHYLIQGIQIDLARGVTSFTYYEGTWDKLPDFDKLKPHASGKGAAFDLSAARRGSDYALRFEGFFQVDRTGAYRFTVTSDDGSRLYVDDKQVVNNDGIHPPQTKAGTVQLTKGVHKVVVGFFQGGGGAELDVQIDGPGLAKQGLSGLVAATPAGLEAKPKPKQDDPDFLDVQPQLVERGRALFTSAGCASCHQLNADKKPLASTLAAAPLNKLRGEGGCLSEKPRQGSPWYALSGRQRTALAAAIQTPPKVSNEPAAVIHRTMTTLNCYACHTRDKVGGPLAGLDKFFQTSQPEMGDEARLPPPLDGVGAKMKPDYLRMLLDKGVHDRPYMHTRMPGFGAANTAAFADAVLGLDKLAATPEVGFGDALGKAKSAGRHLTGAQGTGCIKCHTFNGVKAEGTQGIDMTLMPKRVTRDWFHAYVLDPQKIRPGTRMPGSWPDGKTFYPDLLDGKAANQIEAIWVYLRDGKDAQLPVGMGKLSIPLVPDKSAIIYRNFIQGAGARAIGVGYPERVNLAFDANELRLALLWQGAFIDAGKHWTDRGVGFEGPLGDNILKLPAGASFAVLPNAEADWPKAPPKEQGYVFKGYRLTPDDRPTFRYSFDGVIVEDFPNPTNGKDQALRRTLTLTATRPPQGLYFRAAAGTKIEALGKGWYRIDGWRMRLEGGAEPQIRQSGGRIELLVPVRFNDGKAQLVQEFVW